MEIKKLNNMQDILKQYETVHLNEVNFWYKAGNISDFPVDGGGCIKYKNMQIAVINFTRRSQWYACQNVCPHKMEMVLSRGMIGSANEIPKIACPMHKKTFSLVDGSNLNGDEYSIATYPVKVVNGEVFVGFLE
jgi:nitrite reductase (NADH) small subunit